MKLQPRYPIYIPTKGRSHAPLTIAFLRRDGVPFRAVVEEHEADAYAEVAGRDRLLILPESGQGLIFARNWIRDHAEAEGHARHWQLDDNIRCIRRAWRGRRIPCSSGPALAVVEDLADRYTNVALAGLAYYMHGLGRSPVTRNVHVYSATLVDHAMPYRWRLRYNDDTDLCLQVLAGGLCTLLVSAFLIHKATTMTVSGGNTADLYQGDGRLVMARQLERMWPGVVTVDRRYGRPAHVVRANWRRFDTPLQLKPGLELELSTEPDEYGLHLEAVQPASERMQKLLAEAPA